MSHIYSLAHIIIIPSRSLLSTSFLVHSRTSSIARSVYCMIDGIYPLLSVCSWMTVSGAAPRGSCHFIATPFPVTEWIGTEQRVLADAQYTTCQVTHSFQHPTSSFDNFETRSKLNFNSRSLSLFPPHGPLLP